MPMVTNPSRQQQPRNRGAQRIARSSLDNLMPQIQEQFDNALSVNGVPALFYHKKTSGVACTCSLGDTTGGLNPDGSPAGLPEEPGVAVLNPDGSGNDTYVQSMLHGASISIDRYGSRKYDVSNPQHSEPHSPLIQSQNLINKSGDHSDPFNDQTEPFDTDDLFNSNGLDQLNANLLAANAQTGCGVCLGTGWVGGYDLLNGLRFVLDAQQQVVLENAHIAIEEHPNQFQLDNESFESVLQFEITLPLGVIGVDCIRLWNNKTQVTDGFRLELYKDGVWYLLEDEFLLDCCDGLEHSIRVVVDGGVETNVVTHLEIQLDLGARPLYVEWPRQTESQNLQLAENIDPVQVVISPVVPTVRIGDVIVNTTYERPWLVTTSTDFIDRERNINGWDASARLVQKYEFAWNLFVRRIPHRGDRSAVFTRLKDSREQGYEPYSPNKATANR